MFILIALPSIGFSQIKKDSLFLQYLLAKDQHRQAITLLSQFQGHYSDSSQQRFELPYWKGMSYYSLKQLDSAAYYLGHVRPESSYYNKSLFLAGISHSYLQQTTQARRVFLSIPTQNDTLTAAVKTFELAGIALLERKLADFDSLSGRFVTSYYALQNQQDHFRDYREIIQKQNRKSPIKAALLSAIVPGSGKLYVGGQLGQAISAFFQNAILGIQAYESFRKGGISSPRFIIYGSLFAVFYVGNIWGSALSVKIKRQEFNDKTNEQILFDMHIPLRTIFN
ncbi:MAG: hypothetical protein EAZ50_10025 [Runella slithyformis]|nr:MAG: hypothetical protein EAZ50_10025 [Runella slithyformis]